MNNAHLHLLVNHLPLIFPLVGIIIMIVAFLFKSMAIKRTAYFIFILSAFAALVSVKSGEGAEDILKKIGISQNLMDDHQKTAEIFAILSYVLGGISLLGLWASFKQKTYSKIVAICILAFALALMYFAFETGDSGGKIMHYEIRD